MMSAMFLSKTRNTNQFYDKMMAWFENIYTILDSALRFKSSFRNSCWTTLLQLFFKKYGWRIHSIEEGDLAMQHDRKFAANGRKQQPIRKNTKAKSPEIKTIVTKIGSGKIPTDPMPLRVADLIIVLKDKDEWTSADNWEDE
jgi:cobalt-zinc-cadmium resistance protein CzcA